MRQNSSPIKFMAATTITDPLVKRKTKVCFSIAAYSKDLIANLHHHSNVPIDQGLTQQELSAIEASFNFAFPPDLRSILREGLPVGQGFPNWRSSSAQQLDILINLPILGVLKEVHRRKFWDNRWGNRPEKDDDAVQLAKQFLKYVPVLVPVYRNCYIPAIPCVAGNPIFYVNGLDVRLWSYDVVGFFQQTEFKGGVLRPRSLGHFLSVPLWAATESRTIEFWTELTDHRRVTPVNGGETEKRWWGGNELRRFLEDVRLKLRNGGWKEEDVDEMMMVMEMDGGDEKSSSSSSSPAPSPSSWSSSSDDEIGGVNYVRMLSGMLLRAGWSRGDVMESLGCLTMEEDRTVEIENECGGGDSLFDFEYNNYSCVREGQSRC
ncbi:unnamed protein product [Lactuca saligna]|uniref:Knr4/Smi1-like domain-containing protein n=1 Tax=Lactuca saligna TaxID=75948 RepID=A0AA35V7U7_LACSI|nr:unnamed protein product [Lactuca saligna]